MKHDSRRRFARSPVRRAHLAMLVLPALAACDWERTTEPVIEIESPAQGGFVGISTDECRLISVSGRIRNIEDIEDYAYFVQGKRLESYEIVATGLPGVWTFETTVVLAPNTEETGIVENSDETWQSQDFARRYPRFPWSVSANQSWARRVRPIVAEIVNRDDVGNLSSFVDRDLHTAIDLRRSNCQSWAGEWDTRPSAGNLSVQLAPAGIVALSPLVEAAIPHPDVPAPQAHIDAMIGSGLVGPSGADGCIDWPAVPNPPAAWNTAQNALVAAAIAANTAAVSAGLPRPYPDADSDESWVVCATGFSSEFLSIGWQDPSELLLDPTVDPLAARWAHSDVPFELRASPLNLTVSFSPRLMPDGTLLMSAPLTMDPCVLEGDALVRAEDTVTIAASMQLESLAVTAPGGTQTSARTTLVGVNDICAIGEFRVISEQMAADAHTQVARVYQSALDMGRPQGHLARAVRDTFEQAIPGRIIDETDVLVQTRPIPTFVPGNPEVCEERETGLFLDFDVTARTAPGIFAPLWPGWLHFGDALEDERDDVLGTGYAHNPTTCLPEIVSREVVLREPVYRITTFMTTSPLNQILAALSGESLRSTLRSGTNPEVAGMAEALGLPRSVRGQLEIRFEPTLPSFVGPEWHPQLGHWTIVVTDTTRPGTPLIEAVADLWQVESLEAMGLGVGRVDNHISFGPLDDARFTPQILAIGGSERPNGGQLTNAFADYLRDRFAEHLALAARHQGFAEWPEAIAGGIYTDVNDDPGRWQDNRVLLPVHFIH